MSTAAEPVSASHDADATRQNQSATATLVQEPAAEPDHAIAGRLFSGAPGEPPGEGTTKILRHPTLSHSANTAVRAIALKRAQQHYGNQFVQRAIAGIHRSPCRTSLLQRQCTCGACPECRAAGKRQSVQAKLTIGEPGDKYEQEADTVADRVMRMPESTSMSDEPTVGAQPAEHLHDEGTESVRAQSENGELQASPALQEQLLNSKGNGTPLPKETRSFFESALGADFSDVRVHTGSNAVEMNRNIGAQAFTHGSDIYFNAGKFDPSSPSGKHLLAHELTHTVQQGGSTLRTKPAAQTSGVQTDVPSIQAAWYNFDIPFTDYQFDPSIEGVKTAAGLAKDAAVAGVEGVKTAAVFVKDTAVAGVEWIIDEIKSIINSGLTWLREKWNTIKELASSTFDSLKRSFTNIIDFLLSPFRVLSDAISSLDADSITKTWTTFKQIVSGLGKGFRALTENLLKPVITVWEGISRFVTSLLNRVAGLTSNFLFSKLPEALQRLAHSLIDQLKALWKSISDWWTKILREIQLWINKAVDTVLQFVQQVISFAIDGVLEGIRQFGKLVLFLRDLFTNPGKYIAILTDKSVKAFEGVEGHFASIVQQYFPQEQPAIASAGISGTIQRQPDGSAATEAHTSASWSEIGSGIWKMMGKKWEEFKSNPWSVVKGLLLDLFFPIYGNIKDIIQLFKDIKKIVTGPLSAGSLEEFWTSFLKILDIPILIYHTVVSILMRTLMVPLIVASFIPHPLVKGIAAAVGYGLLGAFVQAELLNIGHKVLLLKTGSTTKGEKDEAYNRVADSFIAMAMTAVIMLVMLILHFIANVMKGVYNFIKGKIVPTESAPAEVKGSSSGEGKTEVGAEEGKGSRASESPKPEGEVASRDGQRSIKLTEKGKIWICASPCEEIRLKYETQLKDNPQLNERIKALEEGYSDLSAEQKAARDVQIRQLEQELADIKLAQEGGVRAAKEVAWPPDPPKGDKPPITAPDAAEWRYQRYVFEKYQKGATPKDVRPPDEWMRRYFDVTAEGGRPGRPGGPEQVAAKNALKAEGIDIVENVELGGRYPDGIDPKLNPTGGKNYFEVGKMLESGIPEARERIKIADEIKAMGPNDTVTFVDKTDVTKRVTYAKGSTPENPTSRSFVPGQE